MKCYELTHYKKEPGFPIIRDPERFYVPISSGDSESQAPVYRAPMCDQLIEPLRDDDHGGTFSHQSRLMRCDIELRDKVYLVSEADGESKDVLVLFHAYQCIKPLEGATSEGEVKIVEGSCEIYEKHNDSFSSAILGSLYSCEGTAFLARMSPGSTVTVKLEEHRRTGIVGKMLGKKRKLYWRYFWVITVDADGVLSHNFDTLYR